MNRLIDAGTFSQISIKFSDFDDWKNQKST